MWIINQINNITSYIYKINITLQQLQYVVALDTHKHFVKAAASCFVTQPTLTLQLKKLEQEISTVIFDRSTQPLEATETGKRFIEQTKRVLWEVDELKQLVNDDKEVMEGTFKVGIIPTLAPNLLPLFIADFIGNHPQTRLVIEELQSERIIELINNKQLDIGILSAPLNEPKIREIPLFQEPFLVYVDENNELLANDLIQDSQLPETGLWVLKEGHCFRNQTLNICTSDPTTQHQNVVMEGASIETLKKLIKAVKGYTLIPELSYDEKNDTKNVIHFQEPRPVRSICLAVHQQFTKERLINELKQSILASLPDSFEKHTKIRMVKWR